MSDSTTRPPRTPTGKALLDAPDVLLMMAGDEIVGLNEGELELQVAAIEAEAAAPDAPHPACIEAYHRELLLTGRTIMSVARVREDVARAEAAAPDAGLREAIERLTRYDLAGYPGEEAFGPSADGEYIMAEDVDAALAAHPAPQWVEACVDPGHHRPAVGPDPCTGVPAPGREHR